MGRASRICRSRRALAARRATCEMLEWGRKTSAGGGASWQLEASAWSTCWAKVVVAGALLPLPVQHFGKVSTASLAGPGQSSRPGCTARLLQALVQRPRLQCSLGFLHLAKVALEEALWWQAAARLKFFFLDLEFLRAPAARDPARAGLQAVAAAVWQWWKFRSV